MSQGVQRGGQNVQKNALKWRPLDFTAWITGKRLKTDGTCCDALTSIEFSFDSCNIYRDCSRCVPRGKQNVVKKRSFAHELKISHSSPIYRYISEMVEDRWVHAARRLTSIEFSFDQCNIYRDGPRGVGNPANTRSVGDSHPSCWTWTWNNRE